MDEFTKLISKIDFNNFFDTQLTRYASIVDNSMKEGQCNFSELIAAKSIFKDNLFQWFIKKINEPLGVITAENIIDVTKVREFIKHSKNSNTIHTCVENELLERVLNVISKPSNQQNNKSVKV